MNAPTTTPATGAASPASRTVVVAPDARVHLVPDAKHRRAALHLYTVTAEPAWRVSLALSPQMLRELSAALLAVAALSEGGAA